MKKYYKYSSAILLFSLLTACTTEPGLDLTDTKIVKDHGKSYSIPKGAQLSPYVDEKVISFYQEIGVKNCQKGDVTWEAENAKDEILTAISNGERKIYVKLAKEGKIGCTSAIN